MEKLSLLVAFLSLIPSIFFTVAKVTGGGFPAKVFFRLFGLSSLLFLTIYILKYYSII